MTAFKSFTCQSCGATIASLEDVQTHAHRPVIGPVDDAGYSVGVSTGFMSIPQGQFETSQLRDRSPARSKRDRINRLRDRVNRARAYGSVPDMADALLGILDLLGDEL